MNVKKILTIQILYCACMTKHPTFRYVLFFSAAFLVSHQLLAQKPAKKDPITTIDTTFDYNELFSQMDKFLDSIYSPHSFAVLSLGADNVYYNFHRTGA